MKRSIFQVIAFLGNVPTCVIIDNVKEVVSKKFDELQEKMGDGFDRIELHANGSRKARRTFTNGVPNMVHIEEAAKALTASSLQQKLKVVPTTEKAVVDSSEGDDTNENENDEGNTTETQNAPVGDSGIDISPAALELAEAHGVDISKVVGSGTNGKIVKSDIEKTL